jgi:hypothetical protein
MLLACTFLFYMEGFAMCSSVHAPVVVMEGSVPKPRFFACAVCSHPITRWVYRGQWSTEGVHKPDPNPLTVIDDREPVDPSRRSPLASADDSEAQQQKKKLPIMVCEVCKAMHFPHQLESRLADPENKPLRDHLRNECHVIFPAAFLWVMQQTRRAVHRSSQRKRVRQSA